MYNILSEFRLTYDGTPVHPMDDDHDSRTLSQKRVETCLFVFFIYLLNTVCSKVLTDRFVLGVKQFTNCLKLNLVRTLPAAVHDF